MKRAFALYELKETGKTKNVMPIGEIRARAEGGYMII